MEATQWETAFSPAFQDLVHTDQLLERMKQLILDFFQSQYTSVQPIPPSKISFSIFQDPEGGQPQPRIEVIYPPQSDADVHALIHAFNLRFKEYLADHALDSRDFLSLRKLQRHFMTIFFFTPSE